MHDEEEHTVLWSANPRAFLDALLAAVPATAQSRVADLRAFVEALRSLTAIPFDGGQFWRIGCFETVERVQQDRANKDGLRVDLVNDEGVFRLRIVITEPLVAVATDVRVRAAGGNGPDMALVFLDKLLSFCGEALVLDLPERGVVFDVEVFGGADHSRLRSHRVIRSQGLTIVSRSVRDDEETWLPLVPPELREQATSGMSSLMTGSGDAGVDAWTTAQATATAYEDAFFPTRVPGFIMVHDHDAQRAAVRAILESAGSGVVVIADPYFDKTALEAHLVGRRDLQASIRIVTSLNNDTRLNSDRDGIDPQLSGAGEPQDEQLVAELRAVDSDAQAALAAHKAQSGDPDIEDEASSARRGVSLRDLLASALANRNDLPRRMEIVNIQSREAGRGEQFHDRFMHVMGPHGKSTLWWFGNSLNSVGRNFPLFLTEVQGSQRLEYAEYVRLLGEGRIAKRTDATAVAHWTNQWTYATREPIAQGMPELWLFPGWKCIVEILGRLAGTPVVLSSEGGIVSTVNDLAVAGFLHSHAGQVTWRLPEDQRAIVSGAVEETLAGCIAAGEMLPLVEALAHWAAHGGLPGDAISLARNVVGSVLASAGRWLDDEILAFPDQWVKKTEPVELAIDDAFDRVANLRYSDKGRHPILLFVRDIGLFNEPAAYWRFVSSNPFRPVYESVTAWKWPLNDDVNAAALALGDSTLVAQIVAVHLENRQPERAALTVRSAVLPDTERAIALSRLLMESRRPVDELRPQFLLEWRPITLNDDMADRLAAMLDLHHPAGAVDLLRALAEEHPECPVLRQRLIERWTRYLAPRPSVSVSPKVLDGYARSMAGDAKMAVVVAEQYASFPDAPRRFLNEVIRPLNLSTLNAPFAKEVTLDLWRDAAHRAIRVVLAGTNLMRRTKDDAVLPQAMTKIVKSLNRQSWGDITYDLLPINTVFELAKAENHTLLDDVITALIRTEDIPPVLRLTAIIATQNGLERFMVEEAAIDIDDALRYFNPNQRRAIVDTLVKRLENSAPESGLLLRLRGTQASITSTQA